MQNKIKKLLRQGKKNYSAQNYEKALEYFTEAAELGDAIAQYFVGAMYDEGKRIPQDFEQAVYWYTKAAEQGDASAQCRLGRMYRDGEGVVKDSEQALYWYTKAAEQGCAGAPPYLVSMHAKKKVGDVPQDEKQAVYWISKDAEQGNVGAQRILGLRYQSGTGVPRDYVRAYAWFDLAASKGDEDSKMSREFLAEHMSQGQIEEGQILSSELYKKIYDHHQ